MMKYFTAIAAVILALTARPVSAAYITPRAITSPQTLGDGRIYVEISFTGDSNEKPLQQPFYAKSYFDLQTQIYAFMAKLNAAADVIQVQLKPGQIVPPPGEVVVIQPTPKPPSAEQQFFIDLNHLYALNAAIAVGVVPMDDQNYLEFQKRVQSEFQTSYVNDNPWPLR